MKNAVVLTGSISSRMVGQPEVIRFFRQPILTIVLSNGEDDSAGLTNIGWAARCRIRRFCVNGFCPFSSSPTAHNANNLQIPEKQAIQRKISFVLTPSIQTTYLFLDKPGKVVYYVDTGTLLYQACPDFRGEPRRVSAVHPITLLALTSEGSFDGTRPHVCLMYPVRFAGTPPPPLP